MPAVDRYKSLGNGLITPLTRGEAVTPHDTNELTRVSRWLWVGGAGNLAFVTAEGDTVTLNGVPAGTQLAVRAKQVLATGTTATSIVAMD